MKQKLIELWPLIPFWCKICAACVGVIGLMFVEAYRHGSDDDEVWK